MHTCISYTYANTAFSQEHSETGMRSPKALLNCPLLSSSREPSKPFQITAMDFYLHYNSTEYLYIHRTQLSEHLAQTASTVGSTAPHNPHPVAEQALMRTVIDVDVDAYNNDKAKKINVVLPLQCLHLPKPKITMKKIMVIKSIDFCWDSVFLKQW